MGSLTVSLPPAVIGHAKIPTCGHRKFPTHPLMSHAVASAPLRRPALIVLLESIAVPANGHRDAIMEQPIQNRRGNHPIIG